MHSLALFLVAGSLGACGAVTVMEDAAGRAAGEAMFGKRSDAPPPAPAAPPPRAEAGAGGGAGAGMGGMPVQAQQAYMQMLFGLVFYSGGIDVSQVPLKPGEFARWQYTGHGSKGVTVERAHLFDDAEGNQWWKGKFVGEDGAAVICEALLSKDGTRLLRERAQFPGEQPREIPVAEGTPFVPPQRLTRQSLNGATQGTESVTVPAGTFTAKKAVFGQGGSTMTWWLVDSVPGGIVKISHQVDGGRVMAEQLLAGTGSGAQSELGTKP